LCDFGKLDDSSSSDPAIAGENGLELEVRTPSGRELLFLLNCSHSSKYLKTCQIIEIWQVFKGKKMRMFILKNKKIFSIFLFSILSTIILFSSTFIVNNPTEIQIALDEASTNTQNDTIIISAGTYNIISTLTFWSDEEYSILLKGEDSPVLNAGDLIRIMELITVANNSDIYLEGVYIEHGRADFGGGLYIETQNAEIRLNDCTIDDNTANNVCGGANLYSIGGNISVTNCTFNRNSSPNSSGYPFGTAGGLFVQTEGIGTEIRVIGCTFEENTAERDAAGAMLYPLGSNSTIVVESNIFNNNIAEEFGGGCWIRCPGGNTSVDYNQNTSSGNSAADAGSGGATYIEIESGTINLSENTFLENSSVWQGGALWINHNGGTINVWSNTFTNNFSNQVGGGANIFLDSGIVTIDHNVFNENESTASGGGLCISTTSGYLDLHNNTFYANTATDGGDVYLYFDNPSSGANFSNNILNSSTFPSLSFSGAQTVTATYSNIEDGTGQPWFSTGCIDADPLLENAVEGDFHLSWDNFPVNDETKSPCIDTGNPASPLDPDGTRNDMGAFYYNQSGLSAPENVTITYSSGTVTIFWDEVTGATSYNVYSDTDPYGTFSNLEQSGLTTTEWSESASGVKKFYCVTAEN